MKQFIVNAFAEDGLKGNPAAVRILGIPKSSAEVLSPVSASEPIWPEDSAMQQIAHRNNLSETAFCLCIDNNQHQPKFHIRWFTPGCEVDLCGHATLATSYVLFRYYFKEAQVLHFQSRSGELHVSKENIPAPHAKTDDADADTAVNFIVQMNFPGYGLERVTDSSEVETVIKTITGCDKDNTQGSGTKGSGIRRSCIKDIYKGTDYVAVLQKPEDVIGFKPDFEKIKGLPGTHNLLITASWQDKDAMPAKLNGYGTCPKTASPDFVSRCFFPKEAIDEDPVTGSAHCTLGPLWANRLGKRHLTAFQASERGGILHLEISGERVIVGGKAVIVQEEDIKEK